MLHNKLPVVPPSNLVGNNNIVTCKLDSGATKTYIRQQDKDIVNNIRKDWRNRSVIMPNNKSEQIQEIGTLNTRAELSHKAKEASIVPGLTSASLLSVGVLCDDGCRVMFDSKKVNVLKNNKTILQG